MPSCLSNKDRGVDTDACFVLIFSSTCIPDFYELVSHESLVGKSHNIAIYSKIRYVLTIILHVSGHRNL